MILPDRKRTIRSYVLRDGRITKAQRRSLDAYWSLYGIDHGETVLDLSTLFLRRAPRYLEVGSGMGEAIVDMAAQHRDNDYLAVEVHRPGVGALMRNVAERRLTNVRLMAHDIMDILKKQLPADSIDCIYLFFPDPWPKKRHYKRRLIAPTFLFLMRRVLKKHGRVFIATDWEDYAMRIMSLLTHTQGIINLAGTDQFAPRPKWRPMTKFEKRGLSEGRTIYDFVFAFE